MPQFRKKPVVIEAHHFTGWDEKASDPTPVFDTDPTGWLLHAMKTDAVQWGGMLGRTMIVQTLEGHHVASVGDWIIRGVKGELYPIKDDIFRQTYEAVDA